MSVAGTGYLATGPTTLRPQVPGHVQHVQYSTVQYLHQPRLLRGAQGNLSILYCTLHHSTMIHYHTTTTIWYDRYSTTVQDCTVRKYSPVPTMAPARPNGALGGRGHRAEGEKRAVYFVPGSGLLLSTAHRHGNAMLDSPRRLSLTSDALLHTAQI
jgi:hypothetical protein